MRRGLDIEEIKRLEQPWRDLGITSKSLVGPHHCINPDHQDENKSFSISVKSNGAIVFNCFGCPGGFHGTIIDAYVKVGLASDSGDAIRKISERYHIGSERSDHVKANVVKKKTPNPTEARAPELKETLNKEDRPSRGVFDNGTKTFYPFDEATSIDVVNMEYQGIGHRALAVSRWDPKGGRKVIRQSWFDGKVWRSYISDKDCLIPLYNFEEMNDPSKVILLVEGEKALRAVEEQARALDMIPTSWIGGANGLKRTDFSVAVGGKCIIWYDNDAAGEAAAEKLAERLGPRTSLLNPFPDMGNEYAKCDAHDWIVRMGKTLSTAIADGLKAQEAPPTIEELLDSSADLDDLIKRVIPEFFDKLSPDDVEQILFADMAGEKYKGRKRVINKAMKNAAPVIDVISPAEVGARIMIANLGGHVTYFNGVFHYYDGRIWQEIARSYVGKLVYQAAVEARTPETQDINKLCRDIEATVTRMCGQENDNFAQVPRNILCVENGELHLIGDKWVLRDFSPKSYLTSYIPARYEPGAKCPMYDKALLEIFSGDQDLVDYWHGVTGYWASKDRSTPAFFVLYGHGANGKSALMNFTTTYLLGPNSTFNARMSELNANFGVINMKNRAIVFDDDLERGYTLPSGLIKKYCGLTEISANRKGMSYEHFTNTCSIVMSANSLPRSKDNSAGTRRRAHIIPFKRQFSEQEQDPYVFSRIAAQEMSGALNAMLAGHLRGIKRPAAVRKATREWFFDANIYARYFSSTDDVKLTIEGYDDFKNWCYVFNHQHRYISFDDYLTEMRELSL